MSHYGSGPRIASPYNISSGSRAQDRVRFFSTNRMSHGVPVSSQSCRLGNVRQVPAPAPRPEGHRQPPALSFRTEEGYVFPARSFFRPCAPRQQSDLVGRGFTWPETRPEYGTVTYKPTRWPECALRALTPPVHVPSHGHQFIAKFSQEADIVFCSHVISLHSYSP